MADHCTHENFVKSVRIRSFSGPYFTAFDTLYLSVFKSNAGKYGPEKLRTRTLFTKKNEDIYCITYEVLIEVFLLYPNRANQIPQMYSESCQTSNMKHFPKIVNCEKLLTTFTKHSILDV